MTRPWPTIPPQSRGAGRSPRRRAGFALTVVVFLIGLCEIAKPEGARERGGAVGAPAGSGAVRILELEGVVSPFSARYLLRELRAAEASGDAAVVLRLDTPGGLLESTRTMTRALLASRVPVVVFVAPQGARAASAGMFLLIAGHVAAMAPGTHVGAAHPVQTGGQRSDGVMDEKIVNDAAAMARAIATTRGRNAGWAEDAVRRSVSATADEAKARAVIDFVAADLDALLTAIDGRMVSTSAGPVAIATRAAPRTTSSMSFPERLLQALVNPDVAYILLTLGIIGLAAELYSPGLLFPGITGAVALLLAFAAFGVLPVSWAGLALIVIGVALLVAELFTEGIGILAGGGVVAFVAGSLVLYRPLDPASPALPDLRISWWLVGVMAAAIAGFFLVVGRAVLRVRHGSIATGPEALLGRVGRASSDLLPRGTVTVDHEAWTAVSIRGPVRRGDPVRVLGVEGVVLHVERSNPIDLDGPSS